MIMTENFKTKDKSKTMTHSRVSKHVIKRRSLEMT